MGNLEIFVESRKLLFTYEMLHLTNFLYHLGLEELGVQEFIDEKHFKGGKLIQISWANSANFIYKLEKNKKNEKIH